MWRKLAAHSLGKGEVTDSSSVVGSHAGKPRGYLRLVSAEMAGSRPASGFPLRFQEKVGPS